MKINVPNDSNQKQLTFSCRDKLIVAGRGVFFAGRWFCCGLLIKIAGFFAGIVSRVVIVGVFSDVLIPCYTILSGGGMFLMKHRLTVGCIVFRIRLLFQSFKSLFKPLKTIIPAIGTVKF